LVPPYLAMKRLKNNREHTTGYSRQDTLLLQFLRKKEQGKIVFIGSTYESK